MEEILATLSVNIPDIIVTALNIVMYFLTFYYRAKVNKTSSTLNLSMRNLREFFTHGQSENAARRDELEARIARCESALKVYICEGSEINEVTCIDNEVAVRRSAASSTICSDGGNRETSGDD